ncbi:hypothetical protein BABINDRAFT_165018 [Babjeviella inositovora NRRL Y-12698]|uniref:WW domain-containing protein n=1 Tax=Babjeviella inositovora NRRL Y-12698 TaxID=984486 RepID=A0A1E3QWU4_9ASCO|nr:uncharacterized protein BABINDRAFT_165018 [Babjeviella inositovora NRRL Y-12698]ODQ81467.1 hypothetical protein BABINDRAFT_165018 [Babjeviella inositovora NRRL Y-12698]
MTQDTRCPPITSDANHHSLDELPHGFKAFWDDPMDQLVYVNLFTGQKQYEWPVGNATTSSDRHARTQSQANFQGSSHLSSGSIYSSNPSEFLPAYKDALAELSPPPDMRLKGKKYVRIFSQQFDKKLYGCKNHRIGHCSCRYVR